MCDGAVGLHQPDVGREGVEALVRPGDQKPVRRVARMVMKHLRGIVNAIVLKADNGHAESVNGRIRMPRIRSRGHRCRERPRTAIHFHLGGLDLYPEGVR